MTQTSQSSPITQGSIIRADFYWKGEPRADGKARNCIVLEQKGRRAVICPITSLSSRNPEHCRKLDNALKSKIDMLDEDHESYINLAQKNVVYLDGPRIHRNQRAREGTDRRIFGRLPPVLASQLQKEAKAIGGTLSKKQVEDDWKLDIQKLRGRDGMAQVSAAVKTAPVQGMPNVSASDTATEKGKDQAQSRDERVLAAAQGRYDRSQESKRPTLSLGGSSRKDRSQGE